MKPEFQTPGQRQHRILGLTFVLYRQHDWRDSNLSPLHLGTVIYSLLRKDLCSEPSPVPRSLFARRRVNKKYYKYTISNLTLTSFQKHILFCLTICLCMSFRYTKWQWTIKENWTIIPRFSFQIKHNVCALVCA